MGVYTRECSSSGDDYREKKKNTKGRKFLPRASSNFVVIRFVILLAFEISHFAADARERKLFFSGLSGTSFIYLFGLS